MKGSDIQNVGVIESIGQDSTACSITGLKGGKVLDQFLLINEEDRTPYTLRLVIIIRI